MKGNNPNLTYQSSVQDEHPFEMSNALGKQVPAESKNDLLPIFNSISDSVIIHDLAGNIFLLNKHAMKLCRISEDDISKYSLSDLPSEFIKYQQFSYLWPEILRGKSEAVKLSLFNEATQKENLFRITLQPISWEGKQVVLAVISNVENLSKFSEEYYTVHRKAEENETKFRNLFEHASDGIFINDKEGNFIEVNASSCKMLGYTNDELLQLKISDVVLLENLKKIPVKFDEMSSGNIVVVERDLVRKDGSVFPAEISGVMFPGGRMQGIVRDISRHKKLEYELIQAREKAEGNDRLKAAFLQNMSHEIRTPLNAIVGFADLIPESFDDYEKMIKFTNIIKEKGCDLIEIIDDILDFSVIESGQITIKLTEYNMNALFTDIENYFYDYQRRLELNRIDFRIAVSKEVKSLDVILDHEKLRQVLINLVSNSFKFTSNGSIVLGCELNEPDVFTFYVSDTGIGIPKEIQNEIFGGFTKVSSDSSKVYGGTGIGLSIVQGLLNIMGGKIWIDSEEYNGSTFYFSLPFESVLKPDIVEDPEDNYRNLTISEYKVLIVEDNYYNTEYLREIFAGSGIPFRHTQYGQKAIEICSKELVPIILLNVRLSDMTGFELAVQLKMMNPNALILAQTTYSNKAEMEKAIHAGCVEYLSSPIKQDVLISKMNLYLKRFNNLFQN